MKLRPLPRPAGLQTELAHDEEQLPDARTSSPEHDEHSRLPGHSPANASPYNLRRTPSRLSRESPGPSRHHRGDSARRMSQHPLPNTLFLSPTTDLATRVARLRTSSPGVPEACRVFVGTWNLHGKDPPPELLEFIPRDRGLDIIALGTQECQTTIAKAFVFPDKAGGSSRPISLSVDGLGTTNPKRTGTRLCHVGSTHHAGIATHQVTTGFFGIMGNKGGVAVSFRFSGASLLFINTHLAPHQRQVHARNADYHKIERQLGGKRVRSGLDVADAVQRQRCQCHSGKRYSKRSATVAPVGGAHREDCRANLATEDFDCSFWFGDLNYRIDGERDVVQEAVVSEDVAGLSARDQLSVQLASGHALHHFHEGPLTFPPTYKFDLGTDNYDSSSKRRVPAWTDRVLFKSRSAGALSLERYSSLPHYTTSDHRPVVAEFTLRLGELRRNTL